MIEREVALGRSESTGNTSPPLTTAATSVYLPEAGFRRNWIFLFASDMSRQTSFWTRRTLPIEPRYQMYARQLPIVQSELRSHIAVCFGGNCDVLTRSFISFTRLSFLPSFLFLIERAFRRNSTFVFVVSKMNIGCVVFKSHLDHDFFIV